MNALHRPLQILPLAVLGSVLIGDPPQLYDWAEAHAGWGDEAVRALVGLGAFAALLWLSLAEDRARARDEPGRAVPGLLKTALGIVLVCFLALVLFHLGW
ncbi:MAG: hypothetical protein IT563_10060 [Alphaproteobacteria bacterium]|nr:hypothetical protein [Alphaproteobacteria bacterium]